jgi:hypothetical protein
MDRRDGR